MAAAKAPMLMKPAMSGVEAPPVKNAPGCWGADGDDDEGKGMMVVVVVEGGASAGYDSVDTGETEFVVSSPGNRLEGGMKGDVIAGGQGDG